MEYDIIHLERHESTLVATICRPDSLNALNSAFFDELEYLMDNEANDETLTALLLIGCGRAFAAGADISEMVKKNQKEAVALSQRGQRALARLSNLPLVVVSLINGFALGGGLEITMACDFRIASDDAKFSLPEVSLGLIPGFAGTQRLPKLVGLANALYMITTGDMISAEEALRIGLVQKIFPTEELMKEAFKICDIIASRGPKAVKLAKSVIRQGYYMDLTEGCVLEAKAFSTLFENEGTEGMTAFLEKRKPGWQK
mgnify:CR=1 FL=1